MYVCDKGPRASVYLFLQYMEDHEIHYACYIWPLKNIIAIVIFLTHVVAGMHIPCDLVISMECNFHATCCTLTASSVMLYSLIIF